MIIFKSPMQQEALLEAAEPVVKNGLGPP